MLEEIKRHNERTADLTEKLLAFSRGETTRWLREIERAEERDNAGSVFKMHKACKALINLAIALGRTERRTDSAWTHRTVIIQDGLPVVIYSDDEVVGTDTVSKETRGARQ